VQKPRVPSQAAVSAEKVCASDSLSCSRVVVQKCKYKHAIHADARGRCRNRLAEITRERFSVEVAAATVYFCASQICST